MGKFLIVAVLIYGCTVLCCEEGIQHSINGTKCQYAQCRNGRWFLMNCRSDLSSNSKNQTLATVCEENDFYSHYSENRAYYKCEKGRLVLKLCGEKEIFDAERKMCREIASKRIKSGNNISAKDNRIITETKKNCTNGEKRKQEGSCKHYYECIEGNELLFHCSKCENYNEKEKKCRYVFQTPCHTKTIPIPEPEVTTCSPPEPSPPTPHTPPSKESTDSSSTDPSAESLTTTESSTKHNSPSLSTSTVRPTVTQQPDSITGEYDTSTNHPTTAATDDAAITVTPAPQIIPSYTTNPSPSTLSPSECVHKQALPNCKYYLECQDGDLVTRICGWMKHFDSKTLECKYMGFSCYQNEKAV